MEFHANIANLGKYSAGQLAETILSFPATTEQVQAALREIGVDGLRYQEIIILECRTSVRGLDDKMGDFDHIDELNYLASRLAELTPEQRSKFSAAAEHDEYGGSLQDLINLTFNLDCYPGLSRYHRGGGRIPDQLPHCHRYPELSQSP